MYNLNDSLDKTGLRTFNFKSDLLNKVIDDKLSPYRIFAFVSDKKPVAIKYSYPEEKVLLILKDEEFSKLVKDGILKKCAENLMSAGVRIFKEQSAWMLVSWRILYKYQEQGFKFALPQDIHTITTMQFNITERG
jgi:hypothetical protein